jgi:dTDP-4-amino-4,6-dideoxygalactose transaminase
MKIEFIDLKARYKDEKDKLNEIFNKVLESGQLILSDENKNLEKNLSEYLNKKYCITLNSGTDALMLALWALGIKKGDEVITPAVSFIATAAAIDHLGAKPVFVDVDEDLNIDIEKIEEKINEKTKAIVPVHWTGKMCDMEKIKNIAQKYDLKIVEDAAQAIGSELDNKKPGYYSNIATFSTHPLKILNGIGDGGFLITNDKEAYEKINKYRNHGIVTRDNYEFYGVNSRMDALNAAIVNYRLGGTKSLIEKRKYNIDLYKSNIKTKNFKFIEHKKNEIESYTMLVSIAEDRDGLQKYLSENEVQSLVYYGTPLHLQNASKKHGYKKGDFPKAEYLCDRVISLPFHQYLKEDEILFVSDLVNKYYK